MRTLSFGDVAVLIGGLSLSVVGGCQMILADARPPFVFGAMTVLLGLTAAAAVRAPARAFRTRWTKARHPLLAIGGQMFFGVSFAALGDVRPTLTMFLMFRLSAIACLIVAAVWYLTAMPRVRRPRLPEGTHAPHLLKGEGPWWAPEGVRATCSCGWTGRPRQRKDRAIADFRAHDESAMPQAEV